MWKITYNTSTGLCTSCNSRDPQEGESVIYLDLTLCGWVNVYPERYKVVNGELVERPEWAQEEADREAAQTAAIAALQARIVEIEAAQATAGLKQYTVPQATQWITNKLTDAPNTIVGVKQAVGEILIKMLPYILPK